MCITVDHCYVGGSKTVVDQYHSGNNLGTGPVLFQYYNVYWVVLLYGDSYAEELDSLRYKRFCDKVSKSTSPVDPQSLPPTSAAAKYHSLRVCYQVMVWKDFKHDLKPEDWGWYVHDGRLLPLQTDKPAAPSEILDVICCSCTKDCSTKKCTCCKYGLHYMPVCDEFRGVSCTNSLLHDLSNGDMNDNDS